MSSKLKPLYELARPESLQDIVLEETLYRKLVEISDNFQSMPHLILYGPPGTGKTTTARALAKKILKKRTVFNYLQLNASADRGVQVIRSQVLKFVSSLSFSKLDAPETPYKIVFLDEADALTADAQNALRNMMQTYASNSRFILSCNVYSKIIPAINSRCLSFEFKPLDEELMYERIYKVVKQNQLPYSEEDLRVSVKNSKGDFRIAFNNLHKEHLDKDYTYQIQSISEFIKTKLTLVPLTKVSEIFKMKKQLIESNHRLFFQKLVEKFCESATLDDFLIIDKLARAEAAIISGASVYTQFMGWIA